MICKRCKLELDECQFAWDNLKPGETKHRRDTCRACRQAMCKRLAKARKVQKKKASLRSGRSYISRNNWLQLLGFASYKEYLGSDLWKDIRRRVFKCKGSLCELCGRQASQIHHNRYHKNDLSGKNMRYLSPLCSDCHKTIEFDCGEKLSVASVARKFKMIRRGRKNDGVIY